MSLLRAGKTNHRRKDQPSQKRETCGWTELDSVFQVFFVIESMFLLQEEVLDIKEMKGREEGYS